MLIDNISDYLRGIAHSTGVLVAFSGGIDSVLLLTAAKDSGLPVLAVTFTHCLQPSTDLSDAVAHAASLGVEHIVIDENPLTIPEVEYNRPDRCYHCKKSLFIPLTALASERGMLLADGTNADDLTVYRPGRRALTELGVRSPLAELGLTKAEVRAIAAQAGITGLASKPSGSCYANRLPYNTRVTPTLIDMIRSAEELLVSRGYLQKRVRLHHDINGMPIARIEVEKHLVPRLAAEGDELISAFKALGFAYITLDLEGWRSGSMDIALKIEPKQQ